MVALDTRRATTPSPAQSTATVDNRSIGVENRSSLGGVELQHCTLAHGDHADGRCAWCGEALPPLRRRWCRDACELAWKVNHVWKCARVEALVRHPRCVICGDIEDLEVHHDPPVKAKGGYGHGCQHHQDKLTVLCHDHHVEADAARRRADAGEPTQLSLLTAA